MISVVFGFLWCITIIGAIIGIPAIILNLDLYKGNSSNLKWSSGLEEMWNKRDVKLAAIVGLICSLVGGILIFIGQ
ncbi:MAG: hypothetical protein HPAVJP_4630 [Candidatus Hepatoplasma vulgare]|nr:MAG: hypothetical protein HPAVJP_4630 [Candidatus Hepatoplasma sp.]